MTEVNTFFNACHKISFVLKLNIGQSIAVFSLQLTSPCSTQCVERHYAIFSFVQTKKAVFTLAHYCNTIIIIIMTAKLNKKVKIVVTSSINQCRLSCLLFSFVFWRFLSYPNFFFLSLSLSLSREKYVIVIVVVFVVFVVPTALYVSFSFFRMPFSTARYNFGGHETISLLLWKQLPTLHTSFVWQRPSWNVSIFPFVVITDMIGNLLFLLCLSHKQNLIKRSSCLWQLLDRSTINQSFLSVFNKESKKFWKVMFTSYLSKNKNAKSAPPFPNS